MAKPETLEILRFLLAERIYPLNPSLVRNDTKAASIVRDFLSVVEFSTDEEWWRKRHNERTRLENELLDTSFAVKPLYNMSEDTIRKYIAVLWHKGAFEGDLQFGSVKPTS